MVFGAQVLVNYARSAEQAEQVAKEVNAAEVVGGETAIVSRQCRRELTNRVYHQQSIQYFSVEG